MDNVMDFYFQAPPIARSLTTVVLVTSLAYTLKLLPATLIIFHPYYIWKFPPEIWRLVTAFLVTSGGLGMLFDTYFLYHYLSQLELGHSRFPRKEDLLWYLLFVSGTILAINVTFGLPYLIFLKALILSMVYTVTQDQRGMKARFYFITIPAQLTPYCMILVNLLFPDGASMILLEIEGLIAAHLYDFLSRIWPQFGGTGRNLIPTPRFLTTVVNTVSGLSASVGGAASQAAAAAGGGTAGSTGASTGASRGPLPDSWRTRGPGHRLG